MLSALFEGSAAMRKAFIIAATKRDAKIRRALHVDAPGFQVCSVFPVGVIMGANIGTTITAQIIAFKVSTYALLLVSVGYGTTFFAKRETVR